MCHIQWPGKAPLILSKPITQIRKGVSDQCTIHPATLLLRLLFMCHSERA
jgi:hypothetical protein